MSALECVQLFFFLFCLRGSGRKGFQRYNSILTAISCIKSAASAISPCSSLIFASLFIRRALSISTYIYRTIELIKKFNEKIHKKLKLHHFNRGSWSFLIQFTFPAEILFSVLISSIRVSRSGVWSIYCIACWTIAVTACIETDSLMSDNKNKNKKKQKAHYF